MLVHRMSITKGFVKTHLECLDTTILCIQYGLRYASVTSCIQIHFIKHLYESFTRFPSAYIGNHTIYMKQEIRKFLSSIPVWIKRYKRKTSNLSISCRNLLRFLNELGFLVLFFFSVCGHSIANSKFSKIHSQNH